jgi:Pyruvate/2-oxoacid:ferredoxin oxidoreductase delta subunit
MGKMRKIIEIDEDLCNGCGQCVPSCAEGAIQIVDGKARLVAEKYCDGLGACLGECPMDALHVVEREVEEFEGPAPAAPAHCPPSGCPSARLHSMPRQSQPVEHSGEAVSALTHWPVQIRLVPPSAPFLKDADLLVAADCVPVAYGAFHRDFLAGKVVMLGCPKFDDAALYLQRFTDIFNQSTPRSVTVAVMEVPCCQGLPSIVQQALTNSGKSIPVRKVIVSLDGQIR